MSLGGENKRSEEPEAQFCYKMIQTMHISLLLAAPWPRFSFYSYISLEGQLGRVTSRVDCTLLKFGLVGGGVGSRDSIPKREKVRINTRE
jgi:hypothetical protein